MKINYLEKETPLIYLPDANDNPGIPALVYFIEKYEKGIRITLNKNKVTSYTNFLTNDPELKEVSEDKLMKYSEKMLKKYIVIYEYVKTKKENYKKAEKWNKCRDNINEIFDSKLFKWIKLFPHFYKIRVRLNIIWKYFLGFLRRVVYFFLFIFYLIKDIYDDYFEYIKAKNELAHEIYLKANLIKRVCTSAEERDASIKKKEKTLINAKEKFHNNNLAFFTFIVSFLTLILTLIFHTISNKDMNRKITNLESEKKVLELKLNESDILYRDLKNSAMVKKYGHFTQQQLELNESILDNMSEIIIEMNKLKSGKE